ncbi:MAG: cysteine desulfurase family protein [Clostridia bacterium]|nr:cysteine desulfurase family protein [Clostridia bacterium]
MIYLDHAATTPPDAAVIRAMEQCMRDTWQNPSAAYAAAGGARRALRLARQALAAMLNAEPQSVAFTSGGTEGNNMALTLARGGHAVISAIEHPSVLRAAALRCREVTLVPPDASGIIQPEAVARALRPDTRLISVMLANNETGAIQPVADIGALARARRIPLHCDAVQAFGHIPVDVAALNVDLLTLSGHKLYGPRGVGALFVRQGLELPPLMSGGGQEFGLRPGTENLPAICGLRVSAELAAKDMTVRAARETDLLRAFEDELKRHVPGCRVLAEDAPRLPGVTAVLLPGLASERAIAKLDLLGIQVSGGAACASREQGVSHVYRAMGLTDAEAACVLRVSIGRATTAEELQTAAKAIEQTWRER